MLLHPRITWLSDWKVRSLLLLTCENFTLLSLYIQTHSHEDHVYLHRICTFYTDCLKSPRSFSNFPEVLCFQILQNENFLGDWTTLIHIILLLIPDSTYKFVVFKLNKNYKTCEICDWILRSTKFTTALENFHMVSYPVFFFFWNHVFRQFTTK